MARIRISAVIGSLLVCGLLAVGLGLLPAISSGNEEGRLEDGSYKTIEEAERATRLTLPHARELGPFVLKEVQVIGGRTEAARVPTPDADLRGVRGEYGREGDAWTITLVYSHGKNPARGTPLDVTVTFSPAETASIPANMPDTTVEEVQIGSNRASLVRIAGQALMVIWKDGYSFAVLAVPNPSTGVTEGDVLDLIRSVR